MFSWLRKLSLYGDVSALRLRTDVGEAGRGCETLIEKAVFVLLSALCTLENTQIRLGAKTRKS